MDLYTAPRRRRMEEIFEALYGTGIFGLPTQLPGSLLGRAPEEVRRFLDTKGFSRSVIPTVSREFTPEAAKEIVVMLKAVLAKHGREGPFRNRTYMLLEELIELFEATVAGDLVSFADAWGDLLFVVLSLGVTQGLPCEQIFRAICESNMAKGIGAHKPKTWTRPDLRLLLEEGLECHKSNQPPSPPKCRTRKKSIGGRRR